jgi:hypothetical protein
VSIPPCCVLLLVVFSTFKKCFDKLRIVARNTVELLDNKENRLRISPEKVHHEVLGWIQLVRWMFQCGGGVGVIITLINLRLL